MSGLGSLNGALIGQFAASITPIYFTFFLGLGLCFANILKLDFTPAISVIIQYVCLPALLFIRIATNDPKELDLKLLGADALSKAVPLVLLLIWWGFFSKLGRVKSLEWVITFWMLATLPNTVLIGDQILTPMFVGDPKAKIKSETTTIIFAQSVYWYNCVILLYEIREMFIEDDLAMNPPPPIAADSTLLDGNLTEHEKMQRAIALEEMDKSRTSALEEMDKSRTSWEGRPSSVWDPHSNSAWEGNRPSSAQWEQQRPSSVQWEQQRPSSAQWEPHRPSGVWEQPRPSSTWEAHRISVEAARPSWEIGRPSWSKAPYDPELNDYSFGAYTPRSMGTPSRIMTPGAYMTPTRMTPLYGRFTPSRLLGLDRPESVHSVTPGRGYMDSDHSVATSKLDPIPTSGVLPSEHGGLVPDFDPSAKPHVHAVQPTGLAPAPSQGAAVRLGKMTLKVGRRMLQVPLLYGSVLGFIWSMSRARLPSFLKNSALLCAQQTVGLAMILIGMVSYKFYKGEKGFVPCGQKLLWAGFGLRFLVAPLVMWVCAIAFDIKGYILDYAILQVIVPQGSMTFALAQIYGCKLEVITPAIYIQMIVFVPFILADFALLSKV